MIRLRDGRIVDPANDCDEIKDIYIEGGRIVAPPIDPGPLETLDLTGKIVMAGGIDIHTHIAGPGARLARQLAPSGTIPSAAEIGRLYATMGYTTLVEPALSPHLAVQTHLELAAVKNVNRAALAMIGNDDFLLQLLGSNASERVIDDYLAWVITHSKAMGLAAVNPGAISAYKDTQRGFGLNDPLPAGDVTSRALLEALLKSVERLRLPHPLHLSCGYAEQPGSFVTTIEAMEIAAGRPLHLAQLQASGYGIENDRLSSASPYLAEAMAFHRNVTADIGQLIFGEGVGVFHDPLHLRLHSVGRPQKPVYWDDESGGGGALPYHYQETDERDALQWAIGLELLLLIDDPWRIFLTRFPASGPSCMAYAQIIQLLMDASLRAAWIERLPKAAMAASVLPQLQREYSLSEIAVITRAGPARSLGLKDRGHLGVGAIADIAAYSEQSGAAAMFAKADYVIKDGALIVKNGQIQAGSDGCTYCIAPERTGHAEAPLRAHYQTQYAKLAEDFAMPERLNGGQVRFVPLPIR